MKRWCVWLAAAPVFAADAPPPDVQAVHRHWQQGLPLAAAPALRDQDAAWQFQSAFVERLTGELGRPVGYKAALTSRAAQERAGLSHPILGILLADMLRPDGASWPLAGARPVAEADLLVRVGSAAINDAQTDLELLAGLDAALPFLELGDLLYAPGVQPGVEGLMAINAGARAGVCGAPITLEATSNQLARLRQLRVTLRDGEGDTLAAGDGAALLGDPIEAVRWIRDEVLGRGDRLKPGHLLSLGSFGTPVPLKKAVTLTATYDGLRAGAAASVSCSVVEPAR